MLKHSIHVLLDSWPSDFSVETDWMDTFGEKNIVHLVTSKYKVKTFFVVECANKFCPVASSLKPIPSSPDCCACQTSKDYTIAIGL